MEVINLKNACITKLEKNFRYWICLCKMEIKFLIIHDSSQWSPSHWIYLKSNGIKSNAKPMQFSYGLMNYNSNGFNYHPIETILNSSIYDNIFAMKWIFWIKFTNDINIYQKIHMQKSQAKNQIAWTVKKKMHLYSSSVLPPDELARYITVVVCRFLLLKNWIICAWNTGERFSKMHITNNTIHFTSNSICSIEQSMSTFITVSSSMKKTSQNAIDGAIFMLSVNKSLSLTKQLKCQHPVFHPLWMWCIKFSIAAKWSICNINKTIEKSLMHKINENKPN